MARIRKNPVFKGSRVRVTGSFVLDQQRFVFNRCSGREVCERLRAYIGNQQHAEKLSVSALSGNFRRAAILRHAWWRTGDDALVILTLDGHEHPFMSLIPVLHQLCEIYEFPELLEILNAAQPAPAKAPIMARLANLEAEMGVLMNHLGYMVELMRREGTKEPLDDGLRAAHARTKRLIAEVSAIKADL